MKTCPVCKKDYSDDLNYCLDDGSLLPSASTYELTNRTTEILPHTTNQATDISNAETIVSDSGRISSPPQLTPPTQKVFQMSAMEPASRMGCVLSIGQVAVALAVVIGLGFIGIFYALRESTYVAKLEPEGPKYSNSVANATGNSTVNDNVATNASKPPPTKTESSTPKNPTGNFAFNADSTPGTPRPTVAKTSPKTVPGGVLNGKAIELPKPQYPPAARAVGASGTVSVNVLIDEDGRVVSATATSGHPLLRAASEQAARGARFTPTVLSGQPVKVTGVITYNFVP